MSEVLQFFLGLGALVVGLGYSWGQFKQSRNKSSLDTVNLLKEQIDAMEGKISNQNSLVVNLTGQVQKLKDLVQIKDKKLEEVLQILQGRDPQTAETMILLREYIELNRPFLDELKIKVMPVISKLDKFLDKQVF